METKKDKTVFIEYSTSEKGQHFMTVMQNSANGQRKLIGRIYKQYDQETKKIKYIATDNQGNQIFLDTQDLQGLKKKYIENGKTMAQSIPDNPNRHNPNDHESRFEKKEREKELKQVRAKKSEKSKDQEIER